MAALFAGLGPCGANGADLVRVRRFMVRVAVARLGREMLFGMNVIIWLTLKLRLLSLCVVVSARVVPIW